MTIRERILEYLNYKGISKYKFYQEIGVSNGFLDKVGSIGSDKCEKISYQYEDMNLEWLITGKGEMLKDTGKESEPETKQEQNIQPLAHLLEKMHTEVKDLLTQLSYKSAENHRLLEKVSLLESESERLKIELEKERRKPPKIGARYNINPAEPSMVAEPETRYEKKPKTPSI